MRLFSFKKKKQSKKNTNNKKTSFDDFTPIVNFKSISNTHDNLIISQKELISFHKNIPFFNLTIFDFPLVSTNSDNNISGMRVSFNRVKNLWLEKIN